MKLRSVTSWTTRDGRRRRIRLFEAWRNMLGRTRGGKSKDRGKYWNVDCDFDSWTGFREWSLSKGYRLGMELDREDSTKPYSRDNCQWIPRREHQQKTLAAHRADCCCHFCGGAKRVRHTKRSTAVTWERPDPDVPF